MDLGRFFGGPCIIDKATSEEKHKWSAHMLIDLKIGIEQHQLEKFIDLGAYQKLFIIYQIIYRTIRLNM